MINIIERLIVCWEVLTRRNYAFFSVATNALKFENGIYSHLEGDKVGAYSDFEANWFMTDKGNILPISKAIWLAIEEFARIQADKAHLL